MKPLIALGLLLASAPAQAAGGWKSGNDLLALCQSNDNADVGLCFGYIQGTIDGANWASEGRPMDSVSVPNGVVADQLKDIVVKYLIEHPEYRHYVATGPIMIALKIAFAANK